MADELPAYDAVVQRQRGLWSGLGMDSNAYFGALLNSPPLAAALADLGRFIRQSHLRGSFTDAERELVDMVLTVDFDYWTIGVLHLPDALAVGVRPEAVDALLDERPDRLRPDERQLVDYVRMVVNGTVDDPSHAALQERFGIRGALEYTGLVSFLICTWRLWQALGVEDAGRAAFIDMLSRCRTGEVALPSAHARQG